MTTTQTNATTARDAAEALRRGEQLAVDVDLAVEAIALAVPHLHRHVDPTATDGRRALANFRMLADRAGLPHDHAVFGSWLAIRALRIEAGDAASFTDGCAVGEALLARIGAAPVIGTGWEIGRDPDDATRPSVSDRAPATGEAGAIATPAGTLRIPGCTVSNASPDWASALAAVDAVSGDLGRRAYDDDPDAIVALDWTRPERGGSVDADSIHEDWTPEIATHADLAAHPSQLIQSATLATVAFPDATYRPRLTRRVIRSGRISAPQFEFLVAAGEAHSRHLPLDPDAPVSRPQRVGIYLADGTGAGKTYEALGVVMDNRLHGRNRAVVVLEKRRHLPGFVEAWESFGCDARDFVRLWEHDAEDIVPGTRGILVATYSMLRDLDPDTGVRTRVAQIAQWAGRDFDGAMILDEAQCMRNAAGNDDLSGKTSEVSQQGLAGIELQDALPDARIVYSSATGATDVHNLAYAVRLGLWGPGTPFAERRDFIRTFENGDIGELEQVTLSLKASGVYVARSISYDGVEVVHLPVVLTNEERSIYNAASETWARLQGAFRHAARLCGVPVDDHEVVHDMRQRGLRGAIPYSSLNGIFEASRKNSMATIIASFKARGVVADARMHLDAGESIIVQMQNTYEAQLTRALSRREDASAIRIEPAELVSFAEMIPVEEYHLVDQPDARNPRIMTQVYAQKLDAEGNPVVNAQAANLRNAMIADARSIRLPLPPLDQIVLAFGTSRVAEVTGRSQRLAPDRPGGTQDGASGVIVETRGEQDRMRDIRDFHEGTKTVLCFSVGAGGSSMSYHARIGTPAADRRRRHYLIQLGHRADQVTQGIGRSHRSDQTMPPVAALVTVDLPADQLYASKIVSALFKLGALTQGHRHATSNGMFDERDCLDGPYAAKAWVQLQDEIHDGLVKNYSWEQFMDDMGLNAKGEAKVHSWGKERTMRVLDDPNRMINRVAALTDRRQQLIFDRLRELIDDRIEMAIADGSFSAGPETLKASSLAVIGERLVRTDAVHAGSTRILRIRRRSQLETIQFGDAYRIYLRSKSQGAFANFCKHRTTGAVALIAPGRPIVTALDERIATNDIVTPTGTTTRARRLVVREPWMPFNDWETLEGMWNAATQAAPSESTSFVTIVADALLPVWPTLAKASGARRAVYRLQSDDGRQFVGRPIAPHSLPAFCAALGVSSAPESDELDEIVSHLEAGSRIVLASTQKEPHVLSADWANGRVVGATVQIGAGCTAIPIALQAIPGAGSTRAAGSSCSIASRPRDLRDALSTLLSACPAIYVEDGGPAVAVAAAPTRAAVTQAMASF